MFSSKPEDVAHFREVTHKKPGFSSTTYTFKCPRCKEIKHLSLRRRRGSHIKDGFICSTCKDEIVSRSKLIKPALAED